MPPHVGRNESLFCDESHAVDDDDTATEFIFCYECARKHARQHPRHNLICFQKVPLEDVIAKLQHIQDVVRDLTARLESEDEASTEQEM